MFHCKSLVHFPFIILIICILLVTSTSSISDAYEFPPYHGLDLKISGTISESYSNNVTYASSEDTAIERFTTLMNLGMDMRYTGKRNIMKFSGQVTRELFRPSSEVRNPSETASATLISSLSKHDRLSLSDTFTHTRSPDYNINGFDLDDCREYYTDQGQPPSEVENICDEYAEEFGRFKGWFDSYRNSLRLTYNKTFSDTFNMHSNYNYGLNWSDEEGTSDSEYHAIRLNANYKYSEPLLLTLSYVYQTRNYDDGDVISRQSLSAGIRQYLTKRLVFNGKLGTDRVISGFGDDSITGSASLKGEIDANMSASMAYSHGTNISANTNDTFKNWKVTGRLTRSVIENMNGDVSVFFGRGDYSSTDITDELWGGRFTLSYLFWQSKRGSYFNGELGYSYTDLTSTEKTREYNRNSITANVSLAF